MTNRFKPKRANEEYENLEFYWSKRTKEISAMSEPYVQVTDRYGRLLCRICLILGMRPPKDRQDAVVRDLIADVFDFLYESRKYILAGKCEVAYPVTRRAYESLSLMHICILDKSWADKWADGKKVSNHEIRVALGSHPMGESEEELRKLYGFFSSLSHPNREMIAYRGLGEPNEFVFGSIGTPDLISVADYAIKHLELWFWFCAVSTGFYKKLILSVDGTYIEAYRQTSAQARIVKKWLLEQYRRVWEEFKKRDDVVKPKFL